MTKALKKAFALLVSAMLLCLFIAPRQALAAGDENQGEVVGSAELDDKSNLSVAERKLDSQLLQMARPDLEAPSQGSDGLQTLPGPAVLNAVPGMRTASNTVKVYAQMVPGADFDVLRAVADVEDTDRGNNLAVLNIRVDKLEALAAIGGVVSVRIVHPPIVNTGSVDSEGDAIINADSLRSATGLDGAGVKIGVISDGADNYLSAVATHDLPGAGDPGSVTIRRNAIGGDEGTAMMEIVHDVAPGADIYFHDCGDSMVDFNKAIDDLVKQGCTVICDDVNWLDEYFFADGIISTHLADLIANKNIVYATSAGNQADVHYQGLCKSGIHKASDFRTSTKSTQKDLYIDLEPGTAFYAIMQWDDPIGASTNDYDLYAGPVDDHDISQYYSKSTSTQDGTQDPYESLFLVNFSDTTKRVALWAYNYNAHTNKTLEIYIFTYGAQVEPTNIVTADSIFGHAAVPGVLACAAIDGNPDEHHTGMSTGAIEYYSSRGPVTMAGGVKRQKPDITGVDGVSVTGAGGFENPFYGTSASSPHVAAVAALLWSVYPSYSASQIRQLITANATDMGAAGFDNTYGYGRINALAAAYCTVNYNCQGGPTVPSVQTLRDTLLTEPAKPARAGYVFGGWYQEAACTNPWNFGINAVTANATLFAKWTKLKFTASPSNYKTYVGGRITLTPSVPGGTWDFNEALLSRNDTVFKGLAAGTARVTYTVDGIAVYADVIIYESRLPFTGQDYTPALLLLALGALAGSAAGLILVWRFRKRGKLIV